MPFVIYVIIEMLRSSIRVVLSTVAKERLVSSERRRVSPFDVLDRVIQWVCVALALTIVVAVMWQVIARYVITGSTPWAAELATYAFVWLTMLSIPLGVRRSRHMTLDMWEYFRTRPWMNRALDALATLVVIAVLAVLTWFSVRTLGVSANRLTPGLGISFAFVNAAVPVGCAIAIVFAIEAYVKGLLAVRRGAEKPRFKRLIFAPVEQHEPNGGIN